jgi:hypothetical protein
LTGNNSDDLIISISTDLATVKRALNRLVSDVGQASSGIEKRFASAGKSINNSLTTSMQDRINGMVGIGTTAAKEWNGVLADQQKELDRLRAKYSPLYATISKYKTAVSEIRQAHVTGAISVNEMTAAIQRERQAALASAAAIKGRNSALSSQPKTSNNFQTSNIAAQIQDIGVTASMGMSPMQIALQQGTQLSAVFNDLKRDGQSVGSALASAFASVVSPMSLVTIGAIAAGVALFQYISASTANIPKVDDILAQHQKNIDALGPAYKKVLEEQQKYVRDSPSLADADARDNAANALKRRVEDAQKAYSDIITATQVSIFGSRGSDELSRFNAAKKAIDEFSASIETGDPKVRQFVQAIVDLEKSGEISASAAKELRDFADAARETEKSLSGIAGEADQHGLAMQSLADNISKVKSAEARKELEALRDKMGQGELTTKQLSSAIDVLSGRYPDMSATISELDGVIQKANAARLAIGTVTLGANLAGERPDVAAPKGGRVGASTVDETKSMLLARREVLQDELGFVLRWNDDVNKALEDQAKSLAPKKTRQKSEPKTASDRFAEDLQSVRDRTEALRQEMSLVGLSNEAQTKRRTVLDLEQRALADLREEARKKGEMDLANIQLSPTKIAAIEQEASAYARQSEALRQAQEQQQQLEHWNNVTKDATRGFIDDLIRGESAADAFANALSRIGDALIDDVMNSIFKVNGAANGGGFLSSIFGGLFGGGGGAFPSAPGGLYADGGYTGAGGKYEPAGLVHKGEVVWSQRDIAKAGGVAVVENWRKGYANGGAVGMSVPAMPNIPRISKSSSPVSVSIPISIDATGADAAGLARLERQVAKLKETLVPTILSTVGKAQQGRVL